MSEPIILTKRMIEQIFDDAATSYDRVGPTMFSQFGARLVEQIPLARGARVLDIATGTGAALLPAARRVGPKGHVTGIDLSGEILKEAESIVRANSLTNVELRKMDAEHLEFPDHAFDVVTCAFALFLFPDAEAALREMYRVCKPGGYVAMSNFNKTPVPFEPALPILIQQFIAYRVAISMPPQLAYTPQEMEALLSRFGFHSTETHSETNDIVYVRAEDGWAVILTLPMRVTIMGMSEETRARFKEEYLAKLRPMLRQDGLHLSVAVVYAVAQR
jgi:O-methyltransferase/aklanonic acid methyltransferase